uniref:Metallothionein n=1 Tax=Amphilophus citrinellus TaxID=61819 RepID=A0A3Q0RW62_AMPCI
VVVHSPPKVLQHICETQCVNCTCPTCKKTCCWCCPPNCSKCASGCVCKDTCDEKCCK